MSAIVSAHAGQWTRAHRATLAIVVLALALAVSVGLLVTGFATHSTPSVVPTTSVTHLDPATDNGCRLDRPGRPC